MRIKKTITITPAQENWLNEHKIKISKLIQETIDKLIKEELLEKEALAS